MTRFLISLALLAMPVAAFAGTAVVSATGPCRTEFVLPYAEQCTFAYRGIEKDRSPRSLQDAFAACDRAQSASLACVKSPTRQIHVVALDALYTAVAAQSEIAMTAGQYAVAESLLREKLGIIEAVGREARAGDPGLRSARESTELDIKDALAGQCTWKALAAAGQQQQLLRAHRYGELATLLQQKAADYAGCAHLAATPQHKAYVEYMGFVALEEGGRAAQGAGQRDAASRLYRTCLDGTARSSAYAETRVKGYLKTIRLLCEGRLSGRYRVDQPEPIDADDGKHFKALSL
ncbi:MAG: hypothetical protein IAI49_14810 [Candidatus Eremiobacteraeota bacterium]|nr:hypothetical protein [Candidatus Eremiobacteraeota bacterium]